MAFRLKNLGATPLRVDLADGGLVYLEPQERSRPLREELLYQNVHLAEWERRGLVRREPASMREVLGAEGAAPAAGPTAGASAPVESAPASTSETAPEPVSGTNTASKAAPRKAR